LSFKPFTLALTQFSSLPRSVWQCGSCESARRGLYHTEIFKNVTIEQNHLAAKVETGLKPLLTGYDPTGISGLEQRMAECFREFPKKSLAFALATQTIPDHVVRTKIQ